LQVEHDARDIEGADLEKEVQVTTQRDQRQARGR